MRCFYLLFVLYICECRDDSWYRGYDDKGLSVSSYGGSDDKGYIGDKQDDNKGIDDKPNHEGYSVSNYGSEDKIYNVKDMQNYDRSDKNNDDNKGYDVKNDDGNKKNDYTKDDAKQYDKGYTDKEYDDKRKYNENNDKCRFIGPLYDYRKLDTFAYRTHRYNIKDYSNDDRNRYDYYNGRYYDDRYDYQCKLYEEDKEDIIRPCSLTDWECIRKYLASHSECTPVYGPSPDPLVIPVAKFFMPAVNLTITHTNLKVTGFQSAKITEFYLNKETGNLVIAIVVVNVTQSSPKTFFTYQRTAKEPIVLADFSTVEYNRITFTAVLPCYPHLRLDKAEIHAYVDDSRPTYAVGPGIYNSTDPDVVTTFAQFNLNIPTAIQEAYVFQSFLLTATYIQKCICDFGIDVYGNYLRFLRTKGFVVSPYS